jgi:hydrogenase maturation protein HypF
MVSTSHFSLLTFYCLLFTAYFSLPPMPRYQVRITGIVQGVGFRPFVYGLAQRGGLAGFVGNDDAGVFVEVEGDTAVLQSFLHRLHQSAPPLAHIETITWAEIPPLGESGFRIVASERHTAVYTLISPDTATCPDCLDELNDPTNRRYRYPFTNCTNCGPRYTIIHDIPYDRPQTSMRGFPLCPACQQEYDDPSDRRFHAQPNACPVCGPQISLCLADGTPISPPDLWAEVGQRLAQGQILAVKGLGGYQLACWAGDNTAVSLLRQRKHRPAKPLALMALDVATVRQIALLDEAACTVLTSPAHPILLLPALPSAHLAPAIAPGQKRVGVMLPNTPLHHLLLQAVQAVGLLPVIVLTSGNPPQQPIIIENEQAQTDLANVADFFLHHNRPIYLPCDDSVVATWAGGSFPMRRARGYAPLPISLPATLGDAPVLAVGGELKGALCLAVGQHAFLSQHLGDVGNWETVQLLARMAEHLQTLFRTTAVLFAADQHPNYLSRHWAEQVAGSRPCTLIQHHHAHLASLMAEHGLDGSRRVIGFCFDGTGYGDDGTVWGGEVLLADYMGYERVSHLATVPLVGGDTAVLRPARLALAHLQAAGLPWDERYPAVTACSALERQIIQQQLNSIPTSSMGRLFDAVAAFLGICPEASVSFEGQAAMVLEAIAELPPDGVGYQFAFAPDNRTFSATPLWQELTADYVAGHLSLGQMAGKFHTAVADLVLTLAQNIQLETGLEQVALSGGVWQNITLLELTVAKLTAVGLPVLTHQRIPPNDGGIALGQAAIARAWAMSAQPR